MAIKIMAFGQEANQGSNKAENVSYKDTTVDNALTQLNSSLDNAVSADMKAKENNNATITNSSWTTVDTLDLKTGLNLIIVNGFFTQGTGNCGIRVTNTGQTLSSNSIFENLTSNNNKIIQAIFPVYITYDVKIPIQLFQNSGANMDVVYTHRVVNFNKV